MSSGPYIVRSQATPLWPAGHLPLKGGDRSASTARSIVEAAGLVQTVALPISPLEGEMSGRTEGGTVPPTSPDLTGRKARHAA